MLISVQDYPVGVIIDVLINYRGSAGPTNITSPTVVVYKDGGTTEITGTSTLTGSFDGRVGCHRLLIDTTASASYTAGSFYKAVLSAGTLDGVSLVGEVLCTFTLEVTGGVLALLKSRLIGTIATGTHTAQTGDSFARIGVNGTGLTAIPWNATWDAEVESEAADALGAIRLNQLFSAEYTFSPFAGSLIADLTENDGGVARFTVNALETAPTGAVNPNVLVDTTVTGLSTQTVFNLTAGSNDNDAYNGQAIVLYDVTNSNFPSIRVVSDYVGSTRTVTIDSAPIFPLANGDGVRIFVTAPGTVPPTAATIADAVWDEAITGHLIGGSTGDLVERLDLIATGGAGGLTNARAVLLDNLNATISSRASQTSVDTVDDFLDTEIAAIKAKTDQLVFTTANKVDATIQAAGDFAQAAADKVWSSATRTLTAFSTALALSVWDVALSAIAAGSSIGVLIKTNLNVILSSAFSAIQTKTDQLTFTTANRVDSTVVDKTGFALTAAANQAIRDAVTDDIIDVQGNITLQQCLSILLAACAGRTDTGGVVFRTPNGSAVRITAVVNASNERTSITLAPSA